MNFLFLDVEATGVGEEDRLIQVAYKYGGMTVNELFTPPVPISIESKAIHHITEKHIEGKPAFVASNTWVHLKNLAEQGYVLIAHNAKYDLGMLAKEGIVFNDYICTLKVARHLDDGQFANHQLQYLRYYFGLDIDLGELSPHDALADIIVLEEVNKQLSKSLAAVEDLRGLDIAHRMMAISKLPSLIRSFSFGKHYGKMVAEVANEAPDYLDWLLKQKLQAPEGEEDWIHTLRYYLHK